MVLELRSKGVRELMARAVLLIDHMIRKASLVAARIIRDAMSESQATSERRGGLCVMCVIGVTLTTAPGAPADRRKIVAIWNAGKAGGRALWFYPGLPWLNFSSPACGQLGSVDLRTLDRDPGARSQA
jgi:hypothetical protein